MHLMSFKLALSAVNNQFNSTVCSVGPSAVFISKELTQFALKWSTTAAGDECMFKDNCPSIRHMVRKKKGKCYNPQ